MRKRWLLGILGAGLLPAFSVYADRGSIPIGEIKVRLEEPGQKAVLAWCRGREVLILATELRASRPAEVLEVMPFPSDPVIRKGSYRSFDAVNEFLKKKIGFSRRKGEKALLGHLPGITITQEKRVGPHEITSIEVRMASSVVAWLREALRKRGGDPGALPSNLERVVEDYVERGIRFFVFDFVSVGSTLTPVMPILYEFDSPCPYYPMKITAVTGGRTEVQLAAVIPRGRGPGGGNSFELGGGWRRLFRAGISKREIRSISREAAGLFDSWKGSIDFHFLKFQGEVDGAEDIAHSPYARIAYVFPLDSGSVRAALECAGLGPGDRVELEIGGRRFDPNVFLEGPGTGLFPGAAVPVEERFLHRPKLFFLRLPAPKKRSAVRVVLRRRKRSISSKIRSLLPLKEVRPFSGASPARFQVSLPALKGGWAPRILGKRKGDYFLAVKAGTLFRIEAGLPVSMDGVISIDRMKGDSTILWGRGGETGGRPPFPGAAGRWRVVSLDCFAERPGRDRFQVLVQVEDGTWYVARLTVAVNP